MESLYNESVFTYKSVFGIRDISGESLFIIFMELPCELLKDKFDFIH